MRMYGYVRQPIPANKRDLIYKIMVHQTGREGVYVYLYTSREALFCSFDHHYPGLADALEDWGEEVEEWIPLDDPLPGCQHDCPLPVRVKGRDTGQPRWGQYEILEDGEWKQFQP